MSSEDTNQINKLARTILRNCYARAEGKNILISPLSILLLLSIITDSTAGKTRKEILDVLGNPDAGKILCQLQKKLSEDHSMSLANAVCIKKDMADKINQPYKDLIQQFYGGQVFSSENMAQSVNDWVQEKTNGMISDAVPENVDQMLLCLMNAIAFESPWNKPYEDEDVKDRYFYNSDGTKSRVFMLYGSENRYIENEDFIGFSKYYHNYDYLYMALLPKKTGTTALADALDKVDFSGLYQSGRHAIVHTKMPEFRFDYKQELKPMCQALGVEEAFTDYADFSPVSSFPLKIDSILHKTFIEVNQFGTKAASVSQGWIMVGCLPPEEIQKVYIDRPFVFAIIHGSSGVPVFAGIVNHLDNAKVNPERLKRNLKRNKELLISTIPKKDMK